MDNRISKRRLNDHLSYDWIKYIAIILAAVLLWSLLLTMLSPRVPNNMTFSMFIMTPGVSAEKMNNLSDDTEQLLKDTTLSVSIQHWSPSDQATPSLIQTRFATSEGDIIIVDNYQKTGDEEKDKNIVSSFNGFVDNGGDAYRQIYPLQDFIEEILHPTFTVIDEKEYRARVKEERKFNKIDSEEDIVAGIEKERQLRVALIEEAKKLAGYLGMESGIAGTEIPNLAYRYSQYTQIIASGDGKNLVVGEEKIWGINVGYVNGVAPLKKIDDFLLFGDNEDDPKEYALGLIFKQENMPYCYNYIKVINHIIDKYKA